MRTGLNELPFHSEAAQYEPVKFLDEAEAIVSHALNTGPHVVAKKVRLKRPGGDLEIMTFSNRGYPTKANGTLVYQVDILNGFVEDKAGDKISRYLVVVPPGLTMAEVLCGDWKQTDMSGATNSHSCEERLLDAIRRRAVRND